MSTTAFEDFLTDLRDLADKYLAEQNGQAVATAPPARTKAKPAKAVEEEPVEDDPQAERREELEAMSETALKRLATKLGYDKADIEESSAEDIIVSILADEAEAMEAEEEAEAEAEEEEEAEDESEGYTREDLKDFGLVALKKIAKDEFGETTESLKGLDKESVIAIILGEADEEEEDEPEEDESEEDEPEEDEEAEEDEEVEVTEDYLNGLSDAELKAMAKEWGYKVTPRMKRDAIIDLFF